MKDSTMSLPEQHEEESSPSSSMQTELHSKGAALTRAWSELFSFISKYQAELTVKENTVEIAEREIDVRRKQLEEMTPMAEVGNEEIEKLQEDNRTKERLLSKSQSELSMKEQAMLRVQSDLENNMELLDRTRCDLLDRQNELVRSRGDIERLKSEVTISQEQLQIKDNLLRKLQNQLMKENTELREQLDLERKTLEIERRNLELERRSHELTKRSLRDKPKSARSTSVIEIPDSPPTLDLSVEQTDFGLANIISSTETQSMSSQGMEQESVFHPLSAAHDDASSRIPPMTTPRKTSPWSIQSTSAASKPMPSEITPSFQETFSGSDSYNVAGTSASDTFFPLSSSISQPEDDSKAGITDSCGAMLTETEMQASGYMPGTPSSGASDSNQGPPVPVSGPIPSTSSQGMPPGGSMPMQEGADGKSRQKEKSEMTRKIKRGCKICGELGQQDCRCARCPECKEMFKDLCKLEDHREKQHEKSKSKRGCEICGKLYQRDCTCKKCSKCEKLLKGQHKLKEHRKMHKKRKCTYCSERLQKENRRSHSLREHLCLIETRRAFCEMAWCHVCKETFPSARSLRQHNQNVHGSN